jgi:hypothetical protein
LLLQKLAQLEPRLCGDQCSQTDLAPEAH